MRIRGKNVSGVTLLSLLLGIALGTFLIIAMLQVFGATRANYQIAENLNEMDNVARYAQTMMTKIIGQAGYRYPAGSPAALPSYASAFQPFNTPLYGPTGAAYTSSNARNYDDPAGIVLSYFPGENIFISAVDPDNWDKLWVKFQGAPDGTIRDCNDLYGVTGTAIKVRFYSRTTSAADGTPSTAYYCERQNNNTTYTYSDVPSGTVIIPSTVFSQAMIRCGEDISIYNYVNRWVFCTDVIDRTKVYAIRVAFLLHSRDPVRASNVTQSFYVFNQTISYTDKYLHRLYFFTVLLPYAPNVTKMFQWLS